MINHAYRASLAIISAMIGLSIYGTYQIPVETLLPIHWNLHGEADQYVSRNIGLVLLPALAAFVFAMFAAIPFVDPRQNNVKRSAGLYYASWFGGLALIFVIQMAIVFSASEGTHLDVYFIFLPTCLFIVIIGNYMTKSRSSWFIGVRTPWSLSSERAWIAANRATGWLFVIFGLVAAIASYATTIESGLVILVIGLITSVAVGIAASYKSWKHDSDRDRVT